MVSAVEFHLALLRTSVEDHVGRGDLAVSWRYQRTAEVSARSCRTDGR